MGIEKAIAILKDWVELDRGLRPDDEGLDYAELSDYSKFCEIKNLAIEKVLAEIEELRGIIIKEANYGHKRDDR